VEDKITLFEALRQVTPSSSKSEKTCLGELYRFNFSLTSFTHSRVDTVTQMTQTKTVWLRTGRYCRVWCSYQQKQQQPSSELGVMEFTCIHGDIRVVMTSCAGDNAKKCRLRRILASSNDLDQHFHMIVRLVEHELEAGQN